jgi:hypothetical protein
MGLVDDVELSDDVELGDNGLGVEGELAKPEKRHRSLQLDGTMWHLTGGPILSPDGCSP